MKRAMIVWGGWEGHEPEQGAAYVAAMLRQEGFEVRVEGDVNAFADPVLREMDLIVPMFTRSAITKEPLDNLLAAVEGGAGIAGYHGCLAGSFREAVAFHFMTGCQWVAHPGNIIPFRVNVTRPDDPVMAGIGDFDYLSEQYYLHIDPAIEVLATTTFSGEHAAWIEGVTMPVVYKKRYGAGRVFYTALGHVVREFEHPEMREILRRGLLWASK